MLKKGTMLKTKKILGWLTIALGAIMVLNLGLFEQVVIKYKLIIGILLVFVGFLNTKAGSQL